MSSDLGKRQAAAQLAEAIEQYLRARFELHEPVGYSQIRKYHEAQNQLIVSLTEILGNLS